MSIPVIQGANNIWKEYNDALVELVDCYKNGKELKVIHEKEMNLTRIARMNIKMCTGGQLMEENEVRYVEGGIDDNDLLDIICTDFNDDDDDGIMYINIDHPLLVTLTFLPNDWNWGLCSACTDNHIKFKDGMFPNYSRNLCIIVKRKSLKTYVDTLERPLDESKH